MRAVQYARVSTKHEEQLASLQNMINSYPDICKEMGWKQTDIGVFYKKSGRSFETEYIRGHYVDEGITGTSLKYRQAFKQMINDAKEGKFDLIFVKSVSRFGRSVEDVSKITKDLKEYGIGVYFMDLKVNSLDSSKEFMINLFASLAQQESNERSYAVQKGKLASMKTGKWVQGIAPYGYDLVDKFLQINEEEAKIVKNIYDLYYYQGCGTGKIVRMLNERNVPTKRGGQWSQIQVSRILDNPIYTGRQIQHMTRKVDVNRQLIENVPENEWIEHNFDYLKIIDNELFELVQLEKQNRLEQFGQFVSEEKRYVDDDGSVHIQRKRILKRNNKRYSNTYLFSNLLKCSYCGNTLKRKKRNSRNPDGTKRDLGYEWSCRINDMYGKAKCPDRSSIPEDVLLEEVKKEIIKWKEHDNKMIFNLYAKAKHESYRENESTIAELESELATLNKRRDKNFSLFENDIIGMDEYKKRNDEIQANIDQINMEISRLQGIDIALEKTKLEYKEYTDTLDKIDVNNLTNTELRKIIEEIIIYHHNEPLDGNKHNRNILNYREILIQFKFMNKTAGEIAREIKKRQDELGLEKWLSI